jgi:hypothetical protein
MYFSFTTIIGVGYGEIHPVSTGECMFAFLVQVSGVAFEAIIMAGMVNVLADYQGGEFLESYNAIEAHLKRKNLDQQFRNHIRHYYQCIWESNHGAPRWRRLMEELPDNICSAIKLELVSKTLTDMGLFAGITVEDKLQLMDYLNPITFMPGQVISKQGARVPDLFIFTSGTIRIYHDEILMCKQVVTTSFYDGDRELFFNEPRSKTLIAETFVDGWRLKRHHFGRLMHNNRGLRKVVIANGERKFAADFVRWGRHSGFVSGNLVSTMRTPEVFPRNEFPDIEKGMESVEINPQSYL